MIVFVSSVSYYASEHFDTSNHYAFASTALDPALIFSRVKTIGWTWSDYQFDHYFIHVHTLIIERPVSLSTLASLIDLHQVKH